MGKMINWVDEKIINKIKSSTHFYLHFSSFTHFPLFYWDRGDSNQQFQFMYLLIIFFIHWHSMSKNKMEIIKQILEKMEKWWLMMIWVGWGKN